LKGREFLLSCIFKGNFEKTSMAKTSGNKSDLRRSATVIVERRGGGREVWRVAANGQIRTVTASRASTAVMDKAMVSYRRALQRLADR
jgi:hypothetical protein